VASIFFGHWFRGGPFRIGKSTIFTTQLPLDHWSEVIPDPVIADAIRDRLQHAALEIQITGESYRGVKARKLASKKKEA
jgi:DNA replication protein DnaC